jgi:hypothetical protein
MARTPVISVNIMRYISANTMGELMRSILFPLFMLACAQPLADSPVATAGLDQAPPPFTPVLDVTPIVPGQPVGFSVLGAPVGGTTTFVISTEGLGAGPCPNLLLGRCLDVKPPLRIMPPVVNQDAAYLQLNAPETLAEGPVWVQAVSQINGVGVKSNVVQRYIGDFDGDLIVDTQDNCPSVANPFQEDDDFDGSGAACDCDDNDVTLTGVCPTLVGEMQVDIPGALLFDPCVETVSWMAERDDQGQWVVTSDGVECNLSFGPDGGLEGLLLEDGLFVGTLGALEVEGSWTGDLPGVVQVSAVNADPNIFAVSIEGTLAP